MTTQQRILISVGGCILVAMMVLGAFCLGVYVGSERDDTPAIRADGAPAPAGPVGQPAVPDLPRPPDVTGRIESISGASLTLTTPQGFRTILMDADSRVLRQDGSDGARDDLRPGSTIGIVGEPAADGRSFLAEIIVLLQPQAPRNP